MTKQRRAGILLHPTSFPSPYGIGEIGPNAYPLLEWMARAGFRLWQVLPLGPTGYGDSPYQCFSAFAGNPWLISLESLKWGGWLNEGDLAPFAVLPKDHVDFGAVIPLKERVLRTAFENWSRKADSGEKSRYRAFCAEEANWLDDYALFMALKEANGGKPWTEWPAAQRDRVAATLEQSRIQLTEGIEEVKWQQWIFFTQWQELRNHAHGLGLEIFGDMPIFVAFDSADAWGNRTLFHLKPDGNPTVVAGVPPDYFSATGQRWGNPLYKWEAHIAEGFTWWKERIAAALKTVDLVRIDHFRGFEACWEIPAEEPTAVKGEWVPAPGKKLFETLRAALGDIPIVAEDLGVITAGVVELRKSFGLPGMRVLQFAWGSGPDNAFLPHNHEPDSVVYTGTHDNNTSNGWWIEEATPKMRDDLAEYVGHEVSRPANDLIRLALGSVAELAVVPMQDLLGLGPEGKMNQPGKAVGNWGWRLKPDALTPDLATKTRYKIELFGRSPE